MTHKPTLLLLFTLLLCTTAWQQSPQGSTTKQQHAAAKKRAAGSRHAGTKRNDTLYSPSPDQQAFNASSPHIDTTFLILSNSQINRVLKEFQPHSSALSPEIKTILSTLAGALLTLLTQWLIFGLVKRKEKNKSKLELLAEERRLSYLISGLYRELAWLRVNTAFWYRSYEIRDNNDNEDYAQFSGFRDKVSGFIVKILEATSEYSKTINYFMHLTKKNEAIFPLLGDLLITKYLEIQSSDFASIMDMDNLQRETDEEVVRLRNKYNGLTSIFNSIHSQMKKEIEV